MHLRFLLEVRAERRIQVLSILFDNMPACSLDQVVAFDNQILFRAVEERAQKLVAEQIDLPKKKKTQHKMQNIENFIHVMKNIIIIRTVTQLY